jgi:hypothetical protein
MQQSRATVNAATTTIATKGTRGRIIGATAAAAVVRF